jgi:hypothetical protein
LAAVTVEDVWDVLNVGDLSGGYSRRLKRLELGLFALKSFVKTQLSLGGDSGKKSDVATG